MSNNIHHYNYPSFSSSLLEEIYRSIDDNNDNDNEFDTRSRCHSDSGYARRTKMAKTNTINHNHNNLHNVNTDRDAYGDVYGRVSSYKYVLDQWMEKEKEKAKIRRNSMPDDGKFRHPLKLASSSSTSSSGSSSSTISDTDSLYGTSKPSRKVPKLKPVRTGPNLPEFRGESFSDEISATARKKGGKKDSKLQLQQRALKLYGDLKKVKQPISPGGKLASFLNSLFHNNSSNSNNNGGKSRGKKQRMEVSSTTTTPSTASSYSRSCLSKAPSSAGQFERRSVRFCPVTEVYNDGVCKMDVSRTTTATTAAKTLANDEDFKAQLMEKHRRVEEVAKELLKNYHSNNNNNSNSNNSSNKNSHFRKELKVNVVNDHVNVTNNSNIGGFGYEDDEDDEEDDDESCCSSDLFELDNLLEIGGVDGDRYCQELPVYETIHVATNRAIANGFIL